MKLSFKKHSVLLFLSFLLLINLQVVFAGDDTWREVTPAELQMKTPKVEPDADAEAIFWEVRVDDKKGSKMFYNHYVRIKIFTERGREKFSKFDIPFTEGKKSKKLRRASSSLTAQLASCRRAISSSVNFSKRAKSRSKPNLSPCRGLSRV